MRGSLESVSCRRRGGVASLGSLMLMLGAAARVSCGALKLAGTAGKGGLTSSAGLTDGTSQMRSGRWRSL